MQSDMVRAATSGESDSEIGHTRQQLRVCETRFGLIAVTEVELNSQCDGVGEEQTSEHE